MKLNLRRALATLFVVGFAHNAMADSTTFTTLVGDDPGRGADGAGFMWTNSFEASEGFVVGTTRPDQETCDGLYNSHLAPKANCGQLIEDKIPARSGTQYLRMYCNATQAQLLDDNKVTDSQRAHIVFGRADGRSPCNAMKTNDGTEYWVGFSIYIPSDYPEEYSAQMFFEFISQGELPLTIVYGSGADGHGRGNYHGITWYGGSKFNPSNGMKHFPSYGGTWTQDRGTWIDWVIQVRWYDQDHESSDAVLSVWRNGDQVYSWSDGYNTPNISSSPPSISFVEYNTSCYGPPTYTSEERAKLIRQAALGDLPTSPWREGYFDAITITEGASGKYNYCSVAPPIKAAKPSIVYPANDSNISNSFAVTYGGYSDYRKDSQNCFSYSRTQVQIDEKGGNWLTPIYDSGEISAETSRQISDLKDGSYQLRVRHKSFRKNTSQTYWGEWSDAVSFTVGDHVAKSYSVLKASSPLNIDGNLEEFENAGSINITNFRGTIGDYRLLWDEDNLYIGARVIDSEILSNIAERDGLLWNDDSVELFFDTLSDRTSKLDGDDYKFSVNTLNTQFDANAFDDGWNVAFYSKTNIDSGYTVEMAIPWSGWGISIPCDGKSMGFDLSMNDRYSAGIMQTLWANTDNGTSNNPNGWGEIRFSDQLVDTQSCSQGASRPCYEGLAGTEDLGICKGGMQTCPAGVWGACEGQVLPESEEGDTRCTDGIDNDCDGLKDAEDPDCQEAKPGCGCGRTGGGLGGAIWWPVVAIVLIRRRRSCATANLHSE